MNFRNNKQTYKLNWQQINGSVALNVLFKEFSACSDHNTILHSILVV